MSVKSNIWLLLMTYLPYQSPISVLLVSTWVSSQISSEATNILDHQIYALWIYYHTTRIFLFPKVSGLSFLIKSTTIFHLKSYVPYREFFDSVILESKVSMIISICGRLLVSLLLLGFFMFIFICGRLLVFLHFLKGLPVSMMYCILHNFQVIQ